jgi:hypothetical protein
MYTPSCILNTSNGANMALGRNTRNARLFLLDAATKSTAGAISSASVRSQSAAFQDKVAPTKALMLSPCALIQFSPKKTNPRERNLLEQQLRSGPRFPLYSYALTPLRVAPLHFVRSCKLLLCSRS